MSSTITPNMSLIVPSVGAEPGPTYATDINTSLSLIDSHNHTPGAGVQIPSSGLNINAALTFNGYAATDLDNVQLSESSSASATLGAISVTSAGLFFTSYSGTTIQITNTSSIVTGGSISGLVAPASASYSSGTFTWQSNTNLSANMDFQSAVFRNNTTSSNGLTVSAPSMTGGNKSIVLPLPPATNPAFLTIDSSGNISSSPAKLGALDTGNLAASANILGSQLSPTAAILGTQLSASANILGTQLSASANIVGTQLTNNTVTGTQIAIQTVSGTGIASYSTSNIALGTVSQSNKTDPNVATTIAFSSTTGNDTGTSNTSFTDPSTGVCQVGIFTTGKPVMLVLVSDGIGGNAAGTTPCIRVTSGTTPDAVIRIRDTTSGGPAYTYLQELGPAASGAVMSFPAGCITTIMPTSKGTAGARVASTYQLDYKVFDAASNIKIKYCQLMAYEM